MNASARHVWLRVALLIGVAYFVIGRVFAIPVSHVRAWRLAAWLASGAVYAAHIWHEHFRLRNSPRSAALHVSLAVAIGALALASAATIRSISAGSFRPAWFLALVLWPAITAIPAFLVALVVEAALVRLPGTADAE